MKNLLQIFGVSALALTLFAGSALAQSAETRVLLDRITQLEGQVQDLSRRSYNSGYVPGQTTTIGGGDAAAGGATSPDTVVRLQALESQIRELTGQVERANYQAVLANQNLERLKSDLELRLQAIEQRQAAPVAPAPEAVPPEPPLEDNAAPAAEGADAKTPEEVYNDAYGAMQRKEYNTAEKGFRAFLSDNPNHKLSPNAQYWLGESYFARGNFKAASAVFAESYQKFPKANKAPDSLLKLGLSLSQQGRTKDACTVLRQLTKEYPSAAGSIASRTEIEIKKLKCS